MPMAKLHAQAGAFPAKLAQFFYSLSLPLPLVLLGAEVTGLALQGGAMYLLRSTIPYFLW